MKPWRASSLGGELLTCAAMVLVLGLSCWSMTAQAEPLPSQTRDYLRVCWPGVYSQIFTAKDGSLTSCAQHIWSIGGDIVAAGTSADCTNLRRGLALSAGDVANQIIDWLRANRSNSNNAIAVDVRAAFVTVYRCG